MKNVAMMLFGILLMAYAAFNQLFVVDAQERVTLAAPVVRTSVTEYSLKSLVIDTGDPAVVEDDAVIVELRPNVIEPGVANLRFTYTSDVANTIIRGLNTADLRTLSLQRRVMQRLIADGLIAGTITGTPQ